MIFIAFKFCGILMLNYEFKFHVMELPQIHTLILSGASGFWVRKAMPEKLLYNEGIDIEQML